MNLDLRVYVITTTLPRLGRDHLAIAEAAVRGGATVLQFRDKTMNDAEFAAAASSILAVTRPSNIPLIVNDRYVVAAAIGAEGVHVGQGDAAVYEIRRTSPGMVIGASATSYDEAQAACDAGADYLGVGPIFPTGSKADATSPMGLTELARICRDVKLPVVAIGGIHAGNLESIVDAGVAGAAVIAAVCEAADMAAATAELRSAWEKYSSG
ncbi:MAG: thiamine phosphate synthase [Terriglobales bacterium]